MKQEETEKLTQVLVDGITGRNERIMQLIYDVNWCTEDVHEKDCRACDVASEVAGTIAAAWDTEDGWSTTPAADGKPGDTMLDQLTRIVAFVLHRELLGVRPSLEQLLAQRRGDNTEAQLPPQTVRALNRLWPRPQGVISGSGDAGEQ